MKMVLGVMIVMLLASAGLLGGIVTYWFRLGSRRHRRVAIGVGVTVGVVVVANVISVLALVIRLLC